MSKQTYNWIELKAEYMESPIPEVKEFFTHKFGSFTSMMNKSTIGWSPEKKERVRRIAERAMKDMEKKEAEELAKALKNVRTYFKQRVSNQKELDKLRVRDAKEVWKILRIENGLPANIVHQTNTNISDPEDAINKLQDESEN